MQLHLQISSYGKNRKRHDSTAATGTANPNLQIHVAVTAKNKCSYGFKKCSYICKLAVTAKITSATTPPLQREPQTPKATTQKAQCKRHGFECDLIFCVISAKNILHFGQFCFAVTTRLFCSYSTLRFPFQRTDLTPCRSSEHASCFCICV